MMVLRAAGWLLFGAATGAAASWTFVDPGEALSPGMPLPAAQFMYENASGRRITLYVRNAEQDERLLPPRHARVGGVGVFRWIEGRFACALASGDIGPGELRRLADSVQRKGIR